MRIVKCSLVCLALVLVGACGSGGSSKPAAPTTTPSTTTATKIRKITKTAYIARANAICTTMNRRTDAVRDPGNDPEKVAASLAQIRTIIGNALVKLRALPEPQGDEARLAAVYAKVDALRAGMQSYIDAVHAHDAPAAATAGKRLDTLGNAANAASNQYGLTVCGS